MKKIAYISLMPLVLQLPASAALTDNLVAYYNFEETGTPGLANKIAGATTHNGTFIGTPVQDAGAGFTGNAAFPGVVATNTTNRGTLLAGNSLNVVKGASPTANGGQFTVSTLSSRGTGLGSTGQEYGTLGKNFTLSAWFYSAPDSDNSALSADALRQFVFESALDGASTGQVYDISWGSASGSNSYVPYVGQVIGSGTVVQPSGWHNVVHSFSSDDTTTTLTVYVDGVQTTTLTATTASVDFRGINFGTNRTGTARVFDGMIDEIAAWNRTLSASEAAELFSRGNNGITVIGNAVTVNLTASPTTSGTVSGGGIFATNSTIQVTATANSGYVFSEWTGDFAGKPASFSQAISAPATATAVFIQDSGDTDGDGLSNYDEILIYQTLPGNPDTDGDGIPDGAEVNITQTSPTTSDAGLVTFVQNNLGTAQAGAIALSPVHITRDPVTSALGLSVNIEASADQQTWQTINLGSGSIVPSGNGWNLTIPAPSSTVNSYILRGSRN